MRPRRLTHLLLALGLAVGAANAAAPSTAAAFACGLTVNCATVTVVPLGSGNGTITSDYTKTSNGTLKRLDCVLTAGVTSGTCSLVFSWSLTSDTDTVTLTGTPAAGSLACTGPYMFNCAAETKQVEQSSTFYAGGSPQIALWFQLASRELRVTATGAGTGTVAGSWSGGGSTCSFPGSGCSFVVQYGTAVTLKVTPDAGAAFGGWTGACAGQKATCRLTLKSAYPTVKTSTNVVFQLAGASASATPRPTATPGRTPASPTVEPSSPSATPATAATPGATELPAVGGAADSGVPGWVVVVIGGLAVVAGALGAALVLALRRKPS